MDEKVKTPFHLRTRGVPPFKMKTIVQWCSIISGDLRASVRDICWYDDELCCVPVTARHTQTCVMF